MFTPIRGGDLSVVPGRPATPLLRRRAEVSARLVWTHLQRTEGEIDISRLDWPPVHAADALVDDVDVPPAPSRSALFDCPAVAGADRKLHRGQVLAFDIVTPTAPFSCHLVHVREVLAQVAVVGLDIAALVLTADGTDEIRIDDDDIGFDRQIADIGGDQIVGDAAIGGVDPEVPGRQPHPFMTERWTRLAAGCYT